MSATPREDAWLWGWDDTPGIVSVWAEPHGRALVWRRDPRSGVLTRDDMRSRPWRWCGPSLERAITPDDFRQIVDDPRKGSLFASSLAHVERIVWPTHRFVVRPPEPCRLARIRTVVLFVPTMAATTTKTTPKGETTRGAVLAHALALASEVGLEGVTIGTLAERAAMSKSGLFAHFHSKEALQIAILDEAIGRFVDQVVVPSLKEPRGEPRVQALLRRWLKWARADFMPGGCVFVASIAELDDKPGPVRDRLASCQRDWLDTLTTAIRIAVDERHFKKQTDPRQMAHEILTLAYGTHLISRLLRDPSAEKRLGRAVERIFENARNA